MLSVSTSLIICWLENIDEKREKAGYQNFPDTDNEFFSKFRGAKVNLDC